MAIRPRRRSVRELNDIFRANRGIVNEPNASAPISYQVAPESGGAHNAATGLQGGVSPNQYYHLTAAEHGTLTEGGDAQDLHTHVFYQRYAFFIS